MQRLTILFPPGARRVTVTAEFEPDPIDTEGEDCSSAYALDVEPASRPRPALKLLAGSRG